MNQETDPKIERILKLPDVQRVLDRDNEAYRRRRDFQPPPCEVFTSEITTLEPDTSYAFTIDREAERQLPNIIHNTVQKVVAAEKPDEASRNAWRKRRTIGVVFSGGPAPGGHNVIAGIFDAAKRANPENRVLGFLVGPDGIIQNDTLELDAGTVDRYRNQGGFTMIKTGRTKIDSAEKMTLSRETCKTLGLDALVVIGGDDSNTNAAFLAQEMVADGVQVIGVPKTIDGDIQVRDDNGKVLCAISFGFHTAARAFATSVSNLCTDAGSDVKYWHICKVMGRVASHLAMEVGLQTHANMTFVGEELADYVDEERLKRAEAEGRIDYTAYGMTLRGLSRRICEGIVRRAAAGKNYGVIVIPEGILEFINEIQTFIIKLNAIIAEYNRDHDQTFHEAFPRLEDKLEHLRKLSQQSQQGTAASIWNARDEDLFRDIPAFFQEGLLRERDSHGNFPFSQVKTEKVLLGLVEEYLKILADQGVYKLGIKRTDYEKVMAAGSLDPEMYGPVIFKNYAEGDGVPLLVKPSIISKRTLQRELVQSDLLKDGDEIPKPVQKVYARSMPSFKTQTHFFGYDGRGSAPTRFDCNYTYNLGLTVFSLIANGATGQMAAIKNLENGFDRWEPIGIPIAPLMRLEERKGKLELVIEKSVVNIDDTAFRVYQATRERWLAAEPGMEDDYRKPTPISLVDENEENRPITLTLNALNGK